MSLPPARPLAAAPGVISGLVDGEGSGAAGFLSFFAPSAGAASPPPPPPPSPPAVGARRSRGQFDSSAASAVDADADADAACRDSGGASPGTSSQQSSAGSPRTLPAPPAVRRRLSEDAAAASPATSLGALARSVGPGAVGAVLASSSLAALLDYTEDG
jgi:hypothetical protein